MRYKKISFFLLPLYFFMTYSAFSEEITSQEDLTLKAQQIIQDYAGQLQSALKAAMKTGGPLAAIDVCAQKSPEIAIDLSEKTGWQIGRTSLKIRNSASSADDWEKTILQQFNDRHKAGEDPATMDYGFISEDKTLFRYMKAIPTQKLCLACHGNEITPEIKQQLADYYPDDRATGYSEGMIRGAFTLQKSLSPAPSVIK